MMQLRLWIDIAGPVPHTLRLFASNLLVLIEVAGEKKAITT
jgi:hypothetical protein